MQGQDSGEFLFIVAFVNTKSNQYNVECLSSKKKKKNFFNLQNC